MLRDLEANIPGAYNFKYKEFIKSDIALRYGIKNEPNEDQWRCIEDLAIHILQPVRNKFGPIRITSGFRCIELCNKIGSNSKSNHTRGQAADFEPFYDDVSLYEIMEWIHNNLDYRELIAEFFPSGWIHCAYREGGNIKVLKLKDKSHNYERVKLLVIAEMYK